MKDKINIICFCALLAAICALFVLVPADKKVEELENRSINRAPLLDLQSALSGEFSKEFDDYIADRVGFRTDFILLSKSISGYYGITLKDEPVIVIGNNDREWLDFDFDENDDFTPEPSPGLPQVAGPDDTVALDTEEENTPFPGAGPEKRPTAPNQHERDQTERDKTGGGAVAGGQDNSGASGSGLTGNSAADGDTAGGSGTGAGTGAGTSADAGTAGAGGDNQAQQTASKEDPQPAQQGGADNDGGRETAGRQDGQGEAQPGSVQPVRVGPLLAFPDRLMEIFGYSERACTRYANAINAYAESLEGKARVFSLVTPTSIEFVDEKYKSLSDSEYKAIQTIYNNLANAYPVDAYSYLSAHQDEYIYFRTDHHWTALGAYYAYLAYCDAAGLTPVTIDQYDSFEKTGFIGYLYSFHPTKELRDNPDTIVYYQLKTPLEVSNPLLYTSGGNATYSIFIGGDHPIYRINTSVKNGRTCVILKDSFGNAFVPWVAPNYEDIIVIDPRHFSGSVTGTIAGYDDVDIIILNYAFSAGSGGYVEPLNRIR